MDDGIEVARIEATGGIDKVPDPMRRNASVWRFPIAYHLVTGEVVPSRSSHHRTRKAAIAELAGMPECPPRNPTWLVFSDGRLSSVRTALTFGRPTERGTTASFMSACLVRVANGEILSDDERALCAEYVGQGPRAAAGEYLPNYSANVAARVASIILGTVSA